jgi:hypothetical protein
VTDDTTCPDSFPTETFGRHYYGTTIGCDCLGIWSQWITGDNQMNYGDVCTYNQTYYGCLQARPINPIRQNQINQMRVCGQSTGQMGFLNVTRPVKSTNNQGFECPQNTYQCSNFTNATTTMCVTNMNQCPVTDVQFVLNTNVQNYNTDPTDYSRP